MEYRNLNLTIEEIDIAIDALDRAYMRKLRKAQLTNQPRSEKLIAELRLHQTLLQRLMATKHEEIIPTFGCSESDREATRDTDA